MSNRTVSAKRASKDALFRICGQGADRLLLLGLLGVFSAGAAVGLRLALASITALLRRRRFRLCVLPGLLLGTLVRLGLAALFRFAYRGVVVPSIQKSVRGLGAFLGVQGLVFHCFLFPRAGLSGVYFLRAGLSRKMTKTKVP